MRKLPPKNSPEWAELTQAWQNSPRETILQLARKYGVKPSSIKERMSDEGIKRRPSFSLEPPQGTIPILEDLLNRIVSIPKIELTPLPLTKENGDEETQVLVFSDSQVGQRTEDYNAVTFKTRVKVLQQKLHKIGQIHRKFRPVKNLAVFFLGDIIENERVGFQLTLDELDKVVLDQIFEVSTPAIAELLINSLQLYENIDCYCVRGNHGSLGKFAAASSNWDTVVYKVLELRLREFDRIKFHIEDKHFYQVAEVMGHKYLLLHGDQVPSWMGLPHYGLERRVNRLKVNLPKDFEMAVVGHFHTPNYMTYGGIPVLINGAWVTGADYPLARLGLSDRASQWTFFVNPEYLVTALYELRLEGKA